jgi:hypothetical protein
MKELIVFILPLCFLTGCKKDLGSCKSYKKLSGFEKVIDKNTVSEQPLRDTLLKYPQLQLASLSSYNFGWFARCHVFYKDLMIFSDTYDLQLNAGPSSWELSTTDTIWTRPLNFSLDPAISHEKAIELAKKYVNFDHTCIAYQLGLYCTNRYSIFKYRNYCLAWKIQSDDGNYYIILDASQGYPLETRPVRSGWVD